MVLRLYVHIDETQSLFLAFDLYIFIWICLPFAGEFIAIEPEVFLKQNTDTKKSSKQLSKQLSESSQDRQSDQSLYVRWGKSGGVFDEPGADETGPVPYSDPDAVSDSPQSFFSADTEDEAPGQPRAVLAGCNTGMSADKYARAVAELKGLAKACGLNPVSTVTQNTDSVTHATYMGSGKVSSLKKEVEEHDADIVLFNEALTPMQMRNLEKILDTEVLDRTGLILQIFASRARTREARLQVESAQLQYMLPRLVGMRAELSRQGGGSGRLSNKGAGEQKLELDRRRIEHRIAELRRELEVVSRERTTQRSRRMQTGMTRVAQVGYTNAGKSTVMNALLSHCSKKQANGRDIIQSDEENKKQVFEADMLFATLDTSVRRIDAPGHIPFLLSDTVGFVSDLPHSLVKAFRSTLDEVCCADLLLEVVDFSDPDYRKQIEVTAKTLSEIGAGHIPVVYLYNKTDLAMLAAGGTPAAADSPQDRYKPEEENVQADRYEPEEQNLQADRYAPEDQNLQADRYEPGNTAGGKADAEPSGRIPLQKSRPVPESIPYRRGDILFLAAGRGVGIPEILTLIDDALGEDRITAEFLIPYKKGSLLHEIRSCGALLWEEYLPEGISVKARCRRNDAERIQRLVR